MRFRKVRAAERAAFQARLRDLERLATYPLGDDVFQLDHGPDYFAFFDRLGAVEYWAAVEGERLAAVAAGVLRRVPLRRGAAATTRAWYLADLKVHPDHRGRHLPTSMFARALPWGWLRCRRGYGITMDPPGGAPNRVVGLAGRPRWTPFGAAARLRLWSLDAPTVARVTPLLEAARGPVFFRALEGVKDLVLRSTGRRLPLLHVEHGAPTDDGRSQVVRAPRDGHVHMLCAPEGSDLAAALEAAGLTPSAGATVLAHGLGGCDWDFVRTSEI